jgi:hypothetical protein
MKKTRWLGFIYKGDNGERMKEESVMMLTTQARGTEFLAHHTHIDFFLLPFCFHVSRFLLFSPFSIFVFKWQVLRDVIIVVFVLLVLKMYKV